MKKVATKARRDVLALLAGSALMAMTSRPGRALADEDIPALIRSITGGAPLKDGRIRLTIPQLADTGFSVPVNVEVESPMTANDFVKSLHLIAPRNPRPLIATFSL
ncbi:MAG: thiosulfate oxidation carrier protein SoxY, partial [Betaproteobacteria bacterium]